MSLLNIEYESNENGMNEILSIINNFKNHIKNRIKKNKRLHILRHTIIDIIKKYPS